MEDEKVEILSPHRKHQPHTKDSNLIYKIILAAIFTIIIAGASFAGGITYGRDHNSSATTNTALNTSGSGSNGLGGFARRNRTIGSVTAITSSSISVQPTFGSTTPKTYSITSSTAVTDNGQSSSVASIAVGDTVLVTASSSTSSDAATIVINPSFGGGGGNPGGPIQSQSL